MSPAPLPIELPPADVIAAKMRLFDEAYLIARYHLADECKRPAQVLRNIIKRERAAHYFAGQAIYLSEPQMVELERRCTYRGRERVYDIGPGHAIDLVRDYEADLIAKREYQREWWRKRRRNDVAYNLNSRMRKAVHGCLRGTKKGRPWIELTGYTLADLRAHLEARFTDGMGWHNIGEWHVDHIRPLSSFNITSAECEDFKQAWALSNLQPLWGPDNLKKGARWTP